MTNNRQPFAPGVVETYRRSRPRRALWLVVAVMFAATLAAYLQFC